MSKHDELIERLEGGETGREIDMAVAIHFLPSWANHPEPSELPRLTTSLDAALALVERVRPNGSYCVWSSEGKPGAEIEGQLDNYYGGGLTMAAALVAALLKAEGG
jgi:hypothetical protein